MTDEIDREEANGHSVFGASGAARFLACPASVRASFGLPDTARYEAAEGTVAHGLAEEWLTTGERPDHKIGTVVRVPLFTGTYDVPVDERMMAFVGQYVDWCNDVPGDHYYEQRVDYSRLTPIPNQGGTADHLALRPGWLVLTDKKYGVADQIFAYQNPQVSLYALGAIFAWDWLYDIDKVTIRICQPRLGHFDEWHTTKAELLQFGDWAKGRMHQAWEPNPPFVPGEKQCRYCKARLTCPARLALLDKIVDDVFDDETEIGDPERVQAPSPELVRLPSVKPMSTARLANLLTWRKTIETLFADAFAELDRRAKAGDVPPGWMIAQGKASRRLRDQQGVFDLLDLWGLDPDEAIDRKIKSPSQLEALLVERGGRTVRAAKALLAPFVETVPGGPVLTPVTRGRKPAVDLADVTFEVENE